MLAICSRMCATFCRQGMRECIFGRIQDCSPHSTLQRVLALGTSYPRDVFKLHSPAAHLQCPLKMQSSLSWEKNITLWLFLACVTWDRIWKEITSRRHLKDKKEAVWLFSLYRWCNLNLKGKCRLWVWKPAPTDLSFSLLNRGTVLRPTH